MGRILRSCCFPFSFWFAEERERPLAGCCAVCLCRKSDFRTYRSAPQVQRGCYSFTHRSFWFERSVSVRFRRLSHCLSRIWPSLSLFSLWPALLAHLSVCVCTLVPGALCVTFDFLLLSPISSLTLGRLAWLYSAGRTR